MQLIFILIILLAICVALILSTSSPPAPRPRHSIKIRQPSKKRVRFKRLNTERQYDKRDGSIVGADSLVAFYTSAEA